MFSKLRSPNYAKLDAEAFTVSAEHGSVSEAALRAAREIRGSDQPPALMIFGVMPRSGTVHVGELLRLHPDVFAYANNLWEVPFLDQLSALKQFQQGFLHRYQQNAQQMSDNELLPVFGAAMLAYLRSFGGQGKSILVKEPRVGYLSYFPAVFPFENLLLLMRDGRDVVQSTVKTWPDVRFEDACRRWQLSARAMLDYHALYRDRQPVCWLTRFEDVLDAPEGFVREACQRFGLDPAIYPYDAQQEVEVIGSSTISDEGAVDWSQHVAAPSGFKPSGHWHDWDGARKRTFKKLAGDTLIDAGYAADHGW